MSYLLKPNDESSRDITLTCFNILRANKTLILFPVLSVSIGVISAILFYVVAAWIYLGSFALVFNANAHVKFLNSVSLLLESEISALAIIFAYYLLIFPFILFINASMTAVICGRLQGEQYTLAEGFRAAARVWDKIFFWSVLVGTIGTIFHFLSARLEKFKLPLEIAKFAWAILTYFVMPILVVEKMSVPEAIKVSGSTMKQTWGENLVAQVKIWLFFLPYSFLAIIAIFIAYSADSLLTKVIAGIVGVFGVLTVMLLSSVVDAILRVVLYLYGRKGLIVRGFYKEQLAHTFQDKAVAK